ncbi:serine hydrolase domain-containing protein [Streptomyces anthocyanicus]|uniref:serine hydrolase domain-containing protein n=1 Tax=Streptomyces anthocyanicus TaxID=68174 RepID=UPI003801FF4D
MTEQTDARLPRAGGVDPAAVAAFVRAARDVGNELHSLMLYRDGAVAAEHFWWPYRPELPHSLHSVTKAFTATAVGLAVGEGRLAVTDRVVDLVADRVPRDPGEHLAAMTVEDLLTQTSGHAFGVSGVAWRGLRTSWVDEVLRLPVEHRPGTHFAYSSATSLLLSAAVTAVTGDTLADYLRPRLFEPLGMSAGLRWDTTPDGINTGGNGLSATTEDLLKLAVLHLRHGRWRGRQLLDHGWIEAATADSRGNSYGYHWWLAPEQGAYIAYGAFGQYAFVFPDRRVALAVTGSAPSIVGDRLPGVVFEHLPALTGGVAGAVDGPGDEPTLGRHELLPPPARGRSTVESAVSGRRFTMTANDDDVRTVSADFAGDSCLFSLVDYCGEHRIEVGLGRWIESSTSMPGAALHHGYEPASQRVVAAGTWSSPTAFTMTWQFVDTPFRDTVVLDFTADAVRLTRSVNVNSGPTTRPTLDGRAA